MKKLTKRIAAAVSSAAVAGAAVLGAGGVASAATPGATDHVQRPAVTVKTADYRWDHGVGYLLQQGYSWDENRGWHCDGHITDSAQQGRGGHDRNSHGHDSQDRDRSGGNHGARVRLGEDHHDGHYGDRNDGDR